MSPPAALALSSNDDQRLLCDIELQQSARVIERSSCAKQQAASSTPTTTTSDDDWCCDNDSEDNTDSSDLATTVLPPSSSKAISSCLLYCSCSVSMILVNKSLASSYNHYLPEGKDLNIVLVVFQAVVAAVAVEFCRKMQYVEQYPPLNWNLIKAWAPVNLFFCAMLFTGIAALQTNSVPMVTIFKNITNVLTTLGDYVLFGNKPDGLVMAAFGIMLLGAVAAAWRDITVTFLGLVWMALNCASTSGYVLYMRHVTTSNSSSTVNMSKFGMVYVNNVLCAAFLLPAAIFMGQFTTLRETPALHTTDYMTKNIFAGVVGFALNFASLHCVQSTSPTTYALLGSLNKIPVAFLGYMIFDSAITNETWGYIGVSMTGGFLYSYAKLRTTRNKNNN